MSQSYQQETSETEEKLEVKKYFLSTPQRKWSVFAMHPLFHGSRVTRTSLETLLYNMNEIPVEQGKSVIVAVRIRPLSASETEAGVQSCVSTLSDQVVAIKKVILQYSLYIFSSILIHMHTRLGPDTWRISQISERVFERICF